ncbi:MAG TPA: glycosyltransferase family 39 protein [Gaiellaceae bacterium]|nr:glycosyltransferase family 39 protein [Gaiellaceae bacterium]
MGTLILGLAFVLVAATAALAASCLRLRSAVGFLLAAYLVASAEIVVVQLALSIARGVTRAALLASVAGLLAVAVAVWVRSGRPGPPLRNVVPATRDALRDRAVAVLAALAILTHLYLLSVGLTVPQSLPDTMLYHLPRAALWKQQEAVAYVPDAPDERIDVFPPVAEIEVMSSMILGNGDRYVSGVQLLALVFACIAIFGIAGRLGLSRRAAAFGALSFASFTVVALQAPTALNDLVVASLLTICAYFAMGTSRTELALAALALALAVGTKGTVAFALPVLALFAFASQPRTRWPKMLAFAVAGLAAGSFWFVVNLFETDELDGGVALDRGGDPLAERIRLSVVDLLELSNAEGTGLLASPIWGVSGLALGVAVAIVFAVRGERRVSAAALLAGVVAFFLVPLVVTWVDVADRALAHVGAAVGLADKPAERLPADFYESPMHSSYGLAFVVLFLGSGALVVADVARRRLSPAALVALCGVPLSLVLTALALAYEPQRMRYIAFSVALAAAVLGVAVRVRPLAWTAVALTAVTLAVLVGYFVPRPASLGLLPGNRDPERSARWFIQAEGGNGDPEAFRFLAEEIPTDATLALAVVRNTYVYPAWDAGLRRAVVFVPESGVVPEEAEWLVVGPSRPVDEDDLARAGWTLELASAGGWRIFSRR